LEVAGRRSTGGIDSGDLFDPAEVDAISLPMPLQWLESTRQTLGG